jgi:hypothetical protein
MSNNNNNKYTSCDVVGRGKVFLKNTERGEKFKIIEMSAVEIKIKTSLQLELDTIVNLKIILNSILFDIDVDATGKVVEKLESTENYRIEFIDLEDKAKEEIDDIMKSACNLI